MVTIMTHLSSENSLGCDLYFHVRTRKFKKHPAKGTYQYGLPSCLWLLSLWITQEQGIPSTPRRAPQSSVSFKTRHSGDHRSQLCGWGQKPCLLVCRQNGINGMFFTFPLVVSILFVSNVYLEWNHLQSSSF